MPFFPLLGNAPSLPLPIPSILFLHQILFYHLSRVSCFLFSTFHSSSNTHFLFSFHFQLHFIFLLVLVHTHCLIISFIPFPFTFPTFNFYLHTHCLFSSHSIFIFYPQSLPPQHTTLFFLASTPLLFLLPTHHLHHIRTSQPFRLVFSFASGNLRFSTPTLPTHTHTFFAPSRYNIVSVSGVKLKTRVSNFSGRNYPGEETNTA